MRRDNLPAAPATILADTRALDPVTEDEEAEYFATSIDPSLLNVGNNLLAVEVHQDLPTSSDLSFDLQLEGVLGDPDTDDDGLTDAWELDWFGTLAAQTGSGDADGDGASNFQEMRARTSPLTGTEKFSIASFAVNAAGEPVVSWPSVPGVIYAIERSEDLAAWTRLFPTVIGDGGMKSFTDTTPPAGATQLFYRSVVP